MHIDPSHDPAVEHGTVTRYTAGKCRCEDCREMWAIYWRARRRKMFPDMLKQHGTLGGYRNYGCRCDLCVARQHEWAAEQKVLSA